MTYKDVGSAGFAEVKPAQLIKVTISHTVFMFLESGDSNDSH